MKRVKHERSGLRHSLLGTVSRLNNLDQLNATLRDVVVDANRRMNFDPSHPMSELQVRSGRVVLSSKSRSYARLLSLDGDELARVVGNFIISGASP